MTKKLEPIFLEPVFKDYIWGGTKLKEYFLKDTPFQYTAESWEVSTNKNGKSKISNGFYKGRFLEEVFDSTCRVELFGNKTKDMDRFPLLIKFIDAKENLSVQVHPDDDYALINENDVGKTEMWYVIDCSDNAKIIFGLDNKLREDELQNIIKNGLLYQYFNYENIKKGDVLYIPSGTVHAILGNTLLCEVQQNSDLTYRIYDWDRTDKNGNSRELHIEKALDVIALNQKLDVIHTDSQIEVEKNVVNSKFFKVDKLNIKNAYYDVSSKDTFYAMNVISGEGVLEVNNTKLQYNLKKGDSFIIPSNLGEYSIMGQVEILKSYI